MKKSLIILRGVSGAGKSTVAEMMSEGGCYPILEADQYHYNKDSAYEWKKENIGKAHEWCQAQVKHFMSLSMPKIIVSNTSTTEKELSPYIAMAQESGYSVVSLVVENRHSGKDVHAVPEETLQRQERNIRNSLKLR